jgi:hypothetical protein
MPPGVMPPPRVVREVARLRARGVPIKIVDARRQTLIVTPDARTG